MSGLSEEALFKTILKNSPEKNTFHEDKPEKESFSKWDEERPIAEKKSNIYSTNKFGNPTTQNTTSLTKTQSESVYKEYPKASINTREFAAKTQPESVYKEYPKASINTREFAAKTPSMPQAKYSEKSSDSIKQIQLLTTSMTQLSSNINRIHTLIKTVIVPMLVLIIVLGVGILILLNNK